MKKKFGISLGSAILLAAICVGIVFAFSYTNTDGTWGRIDSTGGTTLDATCDGWGRVNHASYPVGDVIGVWNNVNIGPGGVTETYVRKPAVCAGDVDGDGTFSEWTHSATANWTSLGSYTSTCPTNNALYPYISKYIYYDDPWTWDGLGIEIFNNTGAAVSTTGWSLLLYKEDNVFDIVPLTAGHTIANKGVWVIVNSAAPALTPPANQIFNATSNYYRTVALVYNYSAPVLGDTAFTLPETVQAYSKFDENQVRYGIPTVYGPVWGCPGEAGHPASDFLLQSGFGFQGIEDRGFNPEENVEFPIGRFCHYNNPIYSATNKLETVPLIMNINGVTCPTGWTLVGSPNLTFTYNVSLDETTNNTTPCTYGTSSPQWPGGSSNPNVSGDTGPNRNGCADLVTFSNVAGAQSFTCSYDGGGHTQNYTVSILGFTTTQAGGVCPDVPVGTVSFNRIYTAETSKNCFCVYAAFTKGQITPIVLLYFSAVSAENGILVSWETATEVNNFGFNIYRAEQVEGERIKLNPELIMSALGPGGLEGAKYEFLDETAVVGVTYYYWLEDVPLESGVTPGLYGPISAVR